MGYAGLLMTAILVMGCPRPVRTFHYPRLGITIHRDEDKTLPQWEGHSPNARAFWEPPCTIYATTPISIPHELGHCEWGAGHEPPKNKMNWEEDRNQ